MTLCPCSMSFVKAAAWAAVSAGMRYGTLQRSSGPIPTCGNEAHSCFVQAMDRYAGMNPVHNLSTQGSTS